MATRTAKAHWDGNLLAGKGNVALVSSGAGTYDVSWPARTENPDGLTSPEELIAAAHASCYSMALSHELSTGGAQVESIETTADVTLGPVDGGFAITTIRLSTRGRVSGVDADGFVAAAERAKAGCPVSKALAGGSATIELDAVLEG